ncbi:hypothetical protein [Candidatus Chlorobium masyuteum]|uniref:hypothetical protein n=1 Tax=Candidatus Chlorobium masyuteum TaxID=2716876 RepID=UPI001AA052A2|nr:hypothetical protein [Candidatus Chlorobium masyuteum]
MSSSREGALNVYNAITDFFLIEEMVVPGSCYWNTGIGFDKGEVSEDSDGLHTMQVLGQNMAWLLKKLNT